MARDKLNPSNVFAALCGAAATIAVAAITLIYNIPGLPILPKVALIAAVPTFLCTVLYYYFVLGGDSDAPGKYWRLRYDALRDDLEAGGGFELAYARELGRVLHWLDDAMGDRDADPDSRLARDLGVETRGPTWTAAAYDKCLLLALAYPLVSAFLVWVGWGHVGDAERAFGLAGEDAIGPWGRWTAGAALLGEVFAGYRFAKAEGVRGRLVWVLSFAVASAVAGASAFAVSIAVSLAVVGTYAVPGAGSFLAGGAGAVGATLSVGLGVAGAFDVTSALAFAAAIAVVGGVAYGVASIDDWSANKGGRGFFLGVLTMALTIACYVAAARLGGSPDWNQFGALLLFVGLLTLINAPFDWAAIGLTRWLLRMGLTKTWLWQLFYAGLDALLAGVSIMLLALVCVVAVQFYGDLALYHAKTVYHAQDDKARIIHFAQVFDRLKNHATDYENWWIWSMLFSTAIPSVVNLFIGCLSVPRIWSRPSRWMATQFRDGARMEDPVKIQLAVLLSGQVVFGALMACALLYAVFVYLAPLVVPLYSAWLREISEALAVCNVPAHLMQWWAGQGWGTRCW